MAGTTNIPSYKELLFIEAVVHFLEMDDSVFRSYHQSGADSGWTLRIHIFGVFLPLARDDCSLAESSVWFTANQLQVTAGLSLSLL